MVLPQYDPKTKKMIALYELGPTFVTGSGLSTASADLNQSGQWEVRPVFKSGAKGIDLFNKGAAECYSGATTCPTKQMAIVLDNRVLTAPNIDNPSFPGRPDHHQRQLHRVRGPRHRHRPEVRRPARAAGAPDQPDRVGHARP